MIKFTLASDKFLNAPKDTAIGPSIIQAFKIGSIVVEPHATQWLISGVQGHSLRNKSRQPPLAHECVRVDVIVYVATQVCSLVITISTHHPGFKFGPSRITKYIGLAVPHNCAS